MIQSVDSPGLWQPILLLLQCLLLSELIEMRWNVFTSIISQLSALMWTSVKERLETDDLEKRQKKIYGFEVPLSPFYPCCYFIEFIAFVQHILPELLPHAEYTDFHIQVWKIIKDNPETILTLAFYQWAEPTCSLACKQRCDLSSLL